MVAVVDTGVDYGHPDLEPIMWDDGETIPALQALGGGEFGINTSGEGESSDPMDLHSHGTHCAGIIGANWVFNEHQENGTFGVSGVVKDAQIMAVRTATAQGAFPSTSVIGGYQYIITALKNGVNVVSINNSWGGPSGGRVNDLLVTEAGELGAVSVFAAGNESADLDTFPETATILKDNPYAIVVSAGAESKDSKGAVPGKGTLTYFSNYGAATSDLVAPGYQIMSTVPRTHKVYYEELAKQSEWKDNFERDEVNGNPQFQYNAVDYKEGPSGEFSIIGEGESKKLQLKIIGGTRVFDELELQTDYANTTMDFDVDQNKANVVVFNNVVAKPAEGGKELSHAFALRDDSYRMPISIDPDKPTEQISFPLSDNNGKETANLFWQTFNADDVLCTGTTIEFESITFTSGGYAYSFMNGTSMAAPAVTGQAALVASQFHDENENLTDAQKAQKNAARVIGSAMTDPELADLCVSGGYANVARSIDDAQTVPVLNGITENVVEGSTTITGFFFGEEEGRLKIGETNVAAEDIGSWSDESITFATPDIDKNNYKVEITTSNTATNANKTGHQYFEIGWGGTLYEKLPLPDEKEHKEFYRMRYNGLVGSNGKLYLVGSHPEQMIMIYEYDPANQTWKDLKAGQTQWNTFNPMTKVVARSGNLYIGVGGQLKGEEKTRNILAVYNIETGTWNYDLAYETEMPFALATTLVNTQQGIGSVGGGLPLLGVDILMTDINIVELETGNLIRNDSGEGLSTGRYHPLVKLNGDGSVTVALGSDGFMKNYTKNHQVVNTIETITIDDNTVKAKVDKENAFDTERLVENQTMVPAGGGISENGGINNGFIFSGLAEMDENHAMVSDTYTMDAEGNFASTENLVSSTKLGNPVATTYQGKYYIIGESISTPEKTSFSTTEVNTTSDMSILTKLDIEDLVVGNTLTQGDFLAMARKVGAKYGVTIPDDGVKNFTLSPSTAEAEGLLTATIDMVEGGYTDKAITISIIIPKVIKSLDADKISVSLDTTESPTFRVDAPMSDFVGLYLNGEEVDRSNYDLKEGSTIIALKPAYVKSLGVGTHRFIAKFTTGIAELELTVISSPKTGLEGENNTMILVGMMILAAGAILVAKKKLVK